MKTQCLNLMKKYEPKSRFLVPKDLQDGSQNQEYYYSTAGGGMWPDQATFLSMQDDFNVVIRSLIYNSKNKDIYKNLKDRQTNQPANQHFEKYSCSRRLPGPFPPCFSRKLGKFTEVYLPKYC
mgnify:CR=1 FL=1